jgi:hypothetical protein
MIIKFFNILKPYKIFIVRIYIAKLFKTGYLYASMEKRQEIRVTQFLFVCKCD